MEEPKIKVGICLGTKITINLLNEYYIKNIGILLYGRYNALISNDIITIFDSGDNVIYSNKEISILPSKQDKNTFEIEDVTIGIDFHWEKKENQRFCGDLDLIIEDNNVSAINNVKIEKYLVSVISSEMNANASEEYLKTHAIISRSWVLSRIDADKQKKFNFEDTDTKRIKWYGREEHSNFDVCADDHCQRYQGITRASTNNVINAIEATKGTVLYSNNEICDARFSKCCGGVSEDFENVWEDEKVEYLTAIKDSASNQIKIDLTNEEKAKEWIKTTPDAFCNITDSNLLSTVLNDYDVTTTNFYRWHICYSQKEISEIIKERSGIDFGQVIKLTPLKRGRSGRIYELEVVGTKKTYIFGKELEIRKVLSKSHLYSSAFVIEYGEYDNNIPNQINIYGAGWGHGVGLCQIGAVKMIEEGYNHEKVLKHYFKGAELKKIY